MWFNILTENHGNDPLIIEGLSPLISCVQSTLGRCGHDVTVIPDQLYPGAVNLYFEYFWSGRDFAGEFLRLRQEHGLRIGVIATELMIGGTIPYGARGIRLEGPTKASPGEMLRQRVANFDKVVQNIDFLWCLLERTAEAYRGRCAVTEFFPVGFSREVPPSDRRAPKDIDVFFFGLATPHRQTVIRRLVESGLQVISVGRGTPSGWLPGVILDSLLDRAKIALNLTLDDGAGGPGGVDPRFASCLRIKDMLERGACVVSEDIPLDNPYRDFMISAPVERLAETCRQLLKGDAWREAGRLAAERFRADMDAQRICEPVVARTLSALATHDGPPDGRSHRP